MSDKPAATSGPSATVVAMTDSGDQRQTDDDGRREGQTGDSSPESATGTEPDTTSGIGDEQLPEDPQPSDDNPLVRPLPEGESVDLGVRSSSNPDDDTDTGSGDEDEQEAVG